jgi:hypothetical protein
MQIGTVRACSSSRGKISLAITQRCSTTLDALVQREPYGMQEGRGLVPTQIRSCPAGMQSGYEEALVSIDISDSSDKGLVQQDGLQPSAPAMQPFIKHCLGKFCR